MERHDVIGLYEQSESLVKVFLNEIDGECNKYLFLGNPMVKLFVEVPKNVIDIVNYIRDGKQDADRLKLELLNLREMVKNLQSKAEQKGFSPFARNCETIVRIINAMERFDPIPETGENGCLNIGDEKKTKSLNKAQIIMELKKEPFEPRKYGEPIPYKDCYTRLIEGKIKRSTGDVIALEIIDKQCDFELFKYCVDRADVSKLYKVKKKSYVRIFMNDIAEYFANPSEYRKAAASAFGVEKLNVGTNGEGVRADYRLLMKGVFPDDANYQKKMPKKSK